MLIHNNVVNYQMEDFGFHTFAAFLDLSQNIEARLAIGPRPAGHHGPVRLQWQSMGVVRRPGYD